MKLFIITLLFIPFIAHSQTCVIAKIDSNIITIGSDTRYAIVNTNYITNTADTTYTQGRKIFTVGNITYAVIGNNGKQQKDIADSACRNIIDPRDAVKSYIKAYTVFLGNYLNLIKRSSIDRYNILIETGKPYYSMIIFCGFYEAKPYIIAVGFQVDTDPAGVNISHIAKSTDVVIAGSQKGAHGDINNPEMWKSGTIKTVLNLLKTEAKANPLEVSKPFDIFVISESGIKEITHNKYKSTMDDY
jgi:hypothetical protein